MKFFIRGWHTQEDIPGWLFVRMGPDPESELNGLAEISADDIFRLIETRDFVICGQGKYRTLLIDKFGGGCHTRG